MPLRITQTMMNTQLLSNLNNNMRRMDTWQNQLSTGRRINKPSDDPVGISFAMRYRSDLSANEQFQSNIDGAQSWLSYADTMLGQAGNVMQRLREISVNASNGTNPQAALDAMREEVVQLRDQMVDIANSQFNGKYVFNGQLTDIKPYKDVATASQEKNVDKGSIQFEIGAGVKIAVNVTGDRIFGDPIDPADPHASDNVFNVFDELISAMKAPDPSAPPSTLPTPTPTITELLGKIDSRMGKILDVRSDIGAKTNRVELSSERLSDISLNLEDLQGKTEDADMAEVITRLKMDENVYQASLSTGSKLIQASLIDFLK